MHNKDNIKSLLNEIIETAQIMLNNLDNKSSLKFFAGKLSLLTKQITSCFVENN